MLNFWASYCIPCRKEFPLFREQLAAHPGKFVVLGVDAKDIESDAKDFAKEKKATWPIVVDSNNDVAKAYGIGAVPQTFFIKPNGKVALRYYAGISGRQVARRDREDRRRRRPTEPRHSSQRNQRAAASGAATAHTSSTTSSPTGNDTPGREHGAHGLRERGRRQQLGDGLDRVGQLGQRVGHAAEEEQHEEQAVGEREVGLRAQRAGHEHPDPRERHRADEQQRDGGDESAGARSTRARCR